MYCYEQIAEGSHDRRRGHWHDASLKPKLWLLVTLALTRTQTLSDGLDACQHGPKLVTCLSPHLPLQRVDVESFA